MTKQLIIKGNEIYRELDILLEEKQIKRIFLVCGGSLQFLNIGYYFENLSERTGIQIVTFSDFKPNPTYESVVQGVKLFRKSDCQMIMAVGGGSTIDVAKCIKLYSNMKDSVSYLKQKIVANAIPFIVMPTTAGAGSEATRYAVIYFEGEKQSISDDSCIPSIVLMDASVLQTLPQYQKKSTMLDALCHAIESFWSINSTEESKAFSRKAMRLIVENKEAYMKNVDEANGKMLEASYYAGKAINITQTTAGHAMCYKLTSLFGISHGHAVALCNTKLWSFMMHNLDRCVDKRGQRYLEEIFAEIAKSLKCETSEEGVAYFSDFVDSLELKIPRPTKKEYEILKKSVNPERLSNHPIKLDEGIIDELYHEILGG